MAERSRRDRREEVRRRLPLDDASIDLLDAHTKKQLGTQWASRATAELRVASIFAVMSRDLLVTGADPAVLEVVTRAVSDEVRHAEICRALAERYLGREVAWPAPAPVPMPELASAPDDLRPTLHVVAMACVNETIATAWLERSRADASSLLARAAIRELLADDVHHARMGWAHLASSHVTTAHRRGVSAWLGALLDAAASPWIRHEGTALVDGYPEHGVPSFATTREVVKDTVEDVVLPGLERFGVSIVRGREWCERSFAV